MAKTQVVVKQDGKEPVTKEVLAKAITDIGAAMRQLRMSGLNKRAIVVLVKDSTGVPQRDIYLILESLENLKRDYCN